MVDFNQKRERIVAIGTCSCGGTVLKILKYVLLQAINLYVKFVQNRLINI